MRRIKKRRRIGRQKSIFVDVVPLTVVLLGILAVFIVSTPVMLGGVRLDLPRGDSEIKIVEKEPLIVSIKKDGTVYVGKITVKKKYLSQKLLEIARNDMDTKIFVSADKNLKYENIIEIVSIINSSGFSDVLLVIDVSKSLY